ncbi:MAG: hypothetical protein ACLTYB_05325 [Clostridium paraputrificum]
MKDKETLNESNFYGQVLEEEKKVDTSKPCDPRNPDYPCFMWSRQNKEKEKERNRLNKVSDLIVIIIF